MTFRQVMFMLLESFLCLLLWRVASLDTETSRELADTLPWVIAVLMMVPLARFKAQDLLKALKAWHGQNGAMNGPTETGRKT